MPLDTRIALTGQPLQLESPLTQYGQLMSAVNAGTQNQLAQMQMSAAQREQESVNALNNAYANAYDVKTGKIDRNLLRESLAKGGFGSKLPGIEKSLAEADKEAALLQKTQGEVKAQPTALAKQQADLLDAKLKQSRAFLDTLDPADPNAPARYLQWHEANHADPIIGPALKARGVTADQSRAQIQAAVAKGPQAFADLINGSKLGTEKFMELNKPTTTTIDQGSQSQIFQTPGLGGAPKSVGAFAKTPTPSEFEQLLKDSGMTEDQKKAARASRVAKESTFAPPMQVVMPVAIQDPKDPTKVIYVDRSQAIGQTPAAEVPKPLTAAQTQKLKTEKAADTAHINASQSTANELEKLTNELVGSEDKKIKPHPGLGGITGYAALLPNLPKGSAAQAQQKLDTFKGKILALGREMASQNGKLGNMAVQEWKFVSDAVQALDPKAGNLDVQMRDVVRQAQAFAKNQKSKFDMTYEDTGTTAPAAGGGIDTSNPLLR
jgi:hypothetical protein